MFLSVRIGSKLPILVHEPDHAHNFIYWVRVYPVHQDIHLDIDCLCIALIQPDQLSCLGI